jgi:hypothetical protein
MRAKGVQEVHLSLPEELVREVRASGLLGPGEMEALLREELRRRRVTRLFEAADHLAALPGTPLTAEEVAAEVEEVRRARRRVDAGGR